MNGYVFSQKWVLLCAPSDHDKVGGYPWKRGKSSTEPSVWYGLIITIAMVGQSWMEVRSSRLVDLNRRFFSVGISVVFILFLADMLPLFRVWVPIEKKGPRGLFVYYNPTEIGGEKLVVEGMSRGPQRTWPIDKSPVI